MRLLIFWAQDSAEILYLAYKLRTGRDTVLLLTLSLFFISWRNLANEPFLIDGDVGSSN
jgi:hypothetical protein